MSQANAHTLLSLDLEDNCFLFQSKLVENAQMPKDVIVFL